MGSHNSGSTYPITVAATATLVKGHDIEPRNSLSIVNMSGVVVYRGYSPDVTTSTGFPLTPNERYNEEKYHGNVYCIVVTGTAEIRVSVY